MGRISPRRRSTASASRTCAHGSRPRDPLQRIVIAPAERLVVVRLGRSQDWETFDIRGVMQIVADANLALNGPPPAR